MRAPKTLEANLRYRREILKLGAESKTARDEIRIACERDPIWFTDVFGWTFDPQFYSDLPERPLITYPYQETALRRCLGAIGKHSMIFPKTRRMGVTTLVLAALFWRWCFKDMQSFLLLSAKEDRVDSPENPSCLMWKLQYAWKTLPQWLRPPLDRAHLRFANLANGSVINGESTNKLPDVGGVRTAVMKDEVGAMNNAESVYSAIDPLTNTVFLVSTPRGAYGLFWKMYEKWRAEHPEWVLHLHWTLHPRFSRGLYFTSEATLGYTDPSWDGKKPRSPWYDNACAKAPGPKFIAQEYDISFNEAGGRFFEEDLVRRLLAKPPEGTVRPPVAVGEFDYEDDKLVFREVPRGRLLLWFPVAKDGLPPQGTYIIGIDICWGTGGELSSQSAVSVVNRDTGKKVAEWKYNRMPPAEFARFCVALAKWFYRAKMIWGCQGPGVPFGKTIVDECRYFNIFYREDESTAGHDRTKKIGYSEQGDSRSVMFNKYLDYLTTRRFENPSEAAVLELRQFAFSTTGTIEHSQAMQSDDPENRGKLHGDIAVADALACRLLPDQKVIVTPSTVAYPKNSAGYRLQQYLKNKAEMDYY